MPTDTAYFNQRQVGPPASLASQLLQGWGKPQIWVGRRTAFASRLAPTEKQSSAAARGEAAPLNNER
ncbi:hypothetical protein SAMN05216509_1092 [Pseudomonas sp. B10]|nr:hypothetical protein SAMN05216509_1092 [Pseudomonas sp. B10]